MVETLYDGALLVVGHGVIPVVREFDGAIEDLRSALCPLVIKCFERVDNSNWSAEVLNLNAIRLKFAGITLQQTFEVGCLLPLTERRLNPLEIDAATRG